MPHTIVKTVSRSQLTGASAGARLLKRVFDIDVEHCPKCGGALKIIAAIEDPPVIVKILRHLGLPSRAPPRPCHPRPQQGRNSYSTQLRLTGSARWRYNLRSEKRWFKFLSIAIASTMNVDATHARVQW